MTFHYHVIRVTALLLFMKNQLVIYSNLVWLALWFECALCREASAVWFGNLGTLMWAIFRMDTTCRCRFLKIGYPPDCSVFVCFCSLFIITGSWFFENLVPCRYSKACRCRRLAAWRHPYGHRDGLTARFKWCFLIYYIHIYIRIRSDFFDDLDKIYVMSKEYIYVYIYIYNIYTHNHIYIYNIRNQRCVCVLNLA